MALDPRTSTAAVEVGAALLERDPAADASLEFVAAAKVFTEALTKYKDHLIATYEQMGWRLQESALQRRRNQPEADDTPTSRGARHQPANPRRRCRPTPSSCLFRGVWIGKKPGDEKYKKREKKSLASPIGEVSRRRSEE